MIRDAIVITHGMGSQIPFQSIDEIVQGLQDAHVPITSIYARTVQVEGCKPLQRAELTIGTGTDVRELHLYEAYWAPLTEGNVGIWDTVKFLLSGGLNGVVKRGRLFFRALFGTMTPFEIPMSSTVAVVGAALTLASLLLFNAVAFAVVVKGWWSQAGDQQMLQDLMTVIGMVVHTLIGYGLLLLVSSLLKAKPPASEGRRRLARAGGALAYPAIFGVQAAMIGVSCVVLMLLGRRSGISLDESWWLAHHVRLVLIAGVVTAIGYFLPAGEGRLAALLRLFGHLGAAALAVIIVIELSRPVQQFIELKVSVNDCLAAAHLPLDSKHGGEPAGLYTKLFKSGIQATSFPWSWLLMAAAVAYLISAAATYRQQRPQWPPTGASNVDAVANFVIVFGALSFPVVVYFLAAALNVSMLRALHMSGFWGKGGVIFTVPWVGILAAGVLVRGFLIGYVGDVAAYVASHKLDRFTEVREKIKAVTDSVFRSVYLMKENGAPAYRQVGVVGHSLGSVIAFDALNSVLLQEQLQPADALDVRRRTTLLLTFGSPLDKIAYVYSTLSTATDAVRELLTGAAKPLLSDRTTRTGLTWVNIWAPADVISGSLSFYDGSLTAPDRVINVPDPYATTPLAAHTEYFEHDLLFHLLGAWHQL